MGAARRIIDLYGTEGDDIIRGKRGSDVIGGKNGDDILRGGGGNDFLYGNRGDDILIGGKGNDVLRGGRGTDIFKPGGGDNVILDFEVGNDILEGSFKQVELSSNGDDTLMEHKRGSILFKGLEIAEVETLI